MAEACVQLRSDLEILPESNGGVIVKDPITHGFYRFTPVQASVLEHLDGQQDLQSIASIVSLKHQTEVLEEQLKDFTGKLQALLLLDHPYCWAKLEGSARKKRHRILQNLLFIKIHAFNPDALFGNLEQRLRFCFSPVFAAVSWVTVAIALIVSILNWESLFVSLGTIFSLYSIPLIVIIVFAIMTIHEFAHGLTLKHFGGKVDEMGFMVLYFIPAFYCNVSDAWMLKKRERILVSFAGGYVQFLIWALATICWRFLAIETPASRVCLITIAFCGIQTFLNFNPLIRLDGYYMLSDFLEIPNLRPKAIAYVKNRIKSLLTGNASQGTGRIERAGKDAFLLLWDGFGSIHRRSYLDHGAAPGRLDRPRISFLGDSAGFRAIFYGNAQRK